MQNRIDGAALLAHRDWGLGMVRSAIAVLLLICVSIFDAHAQADDFRILLGRFAGAIKDRVPAPVATGIAPGPVWFWTEIRGNRASIERLRQDKALPLKHSWYQIAAGGFPRDDQAPDFTWVLEDIDDAKFDALAREADARGFFTYRTSSCRSKVTAGNWAVKVTDALGNSLPCSNGQMCRFEVRVSSHSKVHGGECRGASK
jgi:hypothetical protein